jgi:hypothetical protein
MAKTCDPGTTGKAYPSTRTETWFDAVKPAADSLGDPHVNQSI